MVDSPTGRHFFLTFNHHFLQFLEHLPWATQIVVWCVYSLKVKIETKEENFPWVGLTSNKTCSNLLCACGPCLCRLKVHFAIHSLILKNTQMRLRVPGKNCISGIVVNKISHANSFAWPNYGSNLCDPMSAIKNTTWNHVYGTKQ